MERLLRAVLILLVAMWLPSSVVSASGSKSSLEEFYGVSFEAEEFESFCVSDEESLLRFFKHCLDNRISYIEFVACNEEMREYLSTLCESVEHPTYLLCDKVKGGYYKTSIVTTEYCLGDGTLRLKIYYGQSPEESVQADRAVRKLVRKLELRGAKATRKNFQKFLRYVYNHIDYVENDEIWKNSAYHGLKYGETMCVGYAEIVQRFCDLGGYECKSCHVRTLKDNSSHFFNLVKLDGKWFYVDATNSEDIMSNAMFEEWLDKDYCVDEEVRKLAHFAYVQGKKVRD